MFIFPRVLAPQVPTCDGIPAVTERPADGIPPWMTKDSLHMLRNSYLLQGETPWDMYKRAANASAMRLGKPELADKFFSLMWHGWLGLATPVAGNMGTTRGLPISCNSIEPSDDLPSIYTKNAELGMLASKGAGVGIYAGNIRARGALIGTDGSTSNGIVPWCKMYDGTIAATNQGNHRKGQVVFYLPTAHGDIREFLRIRKPGGDENLRCMNSHHAVCITDEEMRRLEAGDPEMKELFQEILRTRIETGEPYLFFTDNVNRVLPLGYERLGLKVKTSNLCSEITAYTDADHSFVCCLSSMNLAKWKEWKDTKAVYYATWFLEGVMLEYIAKAKNIPFFEAAVRFAEKSHMLGLGVLGYHTLLQQEGYPFESFQAQLLNKVIFKHLAAESNKASRDMAEEYGEPEWCKGTGLMNTHTCVTGETKILTKEGQIAIKELVGKKTEIWNGSEWSEVTPYETGVSELLEVDFSNGLTLTCTPDHKFLVATPKRDSNEFGGYKTIEVEAQNLRIGDCLPKFFTEASGSDKELPYAYESGLFSGDGSVNNARDGKYPRKELRLYGAKKALAQYVCWKSKSTWGDPDMVRGYLPDAVLDKYVVPHEYSVLSKQQWLCGLIDADGYAGSASLSLATIHKDFATEVALLVQSLGGEPFVHEVTRVGGYGEGNGKSNLMYIVSISLHSVNNVFSLVQPKRVRVRVLENKTRVGKRHLVEVVSIRRSERKEMTYCFTEPLRGTGVFNGLLTKQCTVAPTVSNSLICGDVSAGIEPLPGVCFERKTAKGTLFFYNPIFRKVLQKYGQDHEDVWMSIVAKKGSVQHLDFLTAEEKELFLTAREINQLEIVRQAADRQKQMDLFRQGQSQSVNLYFPKDADETYVTRVHYLAWKLGLKTLYYCKSEEVSKADLPFRTQQAIDKTANGEAGECLACHG